MRGDGNPCNDGTGTRSISYGTETGGVNIDKVEPAAAARSFSQPSNCRPSVDCLLHSLQLRRW